MNSISPDWFWARVDSSGGPDACWPWAGSIRSEKGPYGRLHISGKTMGAHRFALLVAKGPPPRNNPFACHACDNPPCCNPAHLWWGSAKENDKDSCDKGRKGATRRKIDRMEAARLRRQGWTFSQLATHFRVNQSSIARALRPMGLGGAICPNQHGRALASIAREGGSDE